MTDIRDNILTAYRGLTDGPGRFVNLTDLRAALAPYDYNRGVLDDVLIAVHVDQHVNLVPRADNLSVTDADRQAAVWCGGEYKHRLSADWRN